MFKTTLTNSLYSQFVDSYQTAHSSSRNHNNAESGHPFVYVDEDGIRLVADMMSENSEKDEVVAITVVQDGLMEILSLD